MKKLLFAVIASIVLTGCASTHKAAPRRVQLNGREWGRTAPNTMIYTKEDVDQIVDGIYRDLGH